MTSPKAALEVAQKWLEAADVVYGGSNIEEDLETIKAAIPVAELEGQTVGRLSNLVNDCLANDFNEHWDSYKRANAILTQLEALK